MDGLIALALAKKQVKQLQEEVEQRSLPPIPTTDGVYSLKLVIEQGEPTYTWIAINAPEAIDATNA